MNELRPAGSEITSPLAENIMIELMCLRRNLVNAFDNHTNHESFIAFTRASLKNIETLEEMVKPDIFGSEIF